MGNLRRDLRRQRQRAGNPLPVPMGRGDFDVPLQCQQTGQGQRFLLHDSGRSDDRVLIFATQGNMEVLQQSPHWFMDGTFKTVPEIYFQLFTVHSLVNGQVVPCVYALLPNKQQGTYERILGVLKQNVYRKVQSEGLQVRYMQDVEFGLK